MQQKITATELENNLRQFTGTQSYYRIGKRLMLTEGTKYLADQGACYWLFDLIVSHIVQSSFADQDFVSIKLQRKGQGAVVTLDDGNGNVLADQTIEYTDFPLEKIALYGCRFEQHWIIMLPSES
jgi:hypothetical protein